MIIAMNLYDERYKLVNDIVINKTNKSKKRKHSEIDEEIIIIPPIEDEQIMKNIIHYNSIDCKVLWEIHELMRSVL
jgi:hypothetical protein